MYVVTMFCTTVVLVISFCVVGTLAQDELCPTPNNDSPIENCCALKNPIQLSTFSEFSGPANASQVYKFKNFCDRNCSNVIINGYCDTLTDGGGWLVVQRRTNGTESFHRNWTEYERGFGSLTGELWYGLRALNCLTREGNWEMRIDFTFDNGTKSYMHYNQFQVGPATDNYRLSISGFTGITPTDPFTTWNINGQQFTTYDRDNDLWRGNCALDGHGAESGGWWHTHCNHINPNYNYRLKGSFGFMRLVGRWYTPIFIEMKIRPVNCII